MDRTRRASLPLYRLPELDGAEGGAWRAVRTEFAHAGGRDAPDELDLDRPGLPDSIEPDTLFTQVCGYPMQKFFSSQARLLAAPVYEAEYCDGTTHCGIFVVRRLASYERLDDLRGRSLVFGGPFSNSGMNLPRRTLAEVAHGDSFFESAVETDSQAGNLERVAHGEVDATCVDNVTYAYVALHRPQSSRLYASSRRRPEAPRSRSSPRRRRIQTPASSWSWHFEPWRVHLSGQTPEPGLCSATSFRSTPQSTRCWSTTSERLPRWGTRCFVENGGARCHSMRTCECGSPDTRTAADWTVFGCETELEPAYHAEPASLHRGVRLGRPRRSELDRANGLHHVRTVDPGGQPHPRAPSRD